MSATNNKEDGKQSISSRSTISTSSGVPGMATTQVSITTTSIGSNLATSNAPSMSDSALLHHQQRNGSSRRGLVHSVSIIVEPAIADADPEDDDFAGPYSTPSVSTERRNTIAGPIVLLEDFGFEAPRKAREQDDIVQSLIAHARLRKEEFARLLEEHAQIVNEINRAETSLL